MGVKITRVRVVSDDVVAAAVRIVVPVRYDEEQIPNTFPGRSGDTLDMTWDIVDATRAKVRDWPADFGGFDVHLKVVDEGCYYLLDEDGGIIHEVLEYYVPHDFVPGEYGDYVIMSIGDDGTFNHGGISCPEPDGD